jgi:hemoglobin
MKKDIATRDDIQLLVDSFYELVKADPLIGPIFTEQVKVNWEKHLPVMYNFWENALFFTGNYGGNPMQVHQHLHRKVGLKKEDFDQWLKLFNQTVDTHFSGEMAQLAKQKAVSIASVMQAKIFERKGLDSL